MRRATLLSALSLAALSATTITASVATFFFAKSAIAALTLGSSLAVMEKRAS